MQSPSSPRLRAYLRDALGLDLRSLAVFRIGVGVTLLIDLAVRVPDLERFYSDVGVIPRAAVRGHSPLLPSLHMLSGGWELQAGLLALAAAFAVMLALGWRTRLAAVASWYLLQSLHARDPFVLNGGDVLLRCVLLWAMFLPLGARLGLDARAGRRATSGRVALGVASVGFISQLAIMYVATAALKWGDAWRDGSALYYALSSDHLAFQPLASLLLGAAPLERVIGQAGLETLRALGLPALAATPWITAALTYATLALEYLVPALLLWPWRRGPARAVVVAAFIGFHVCTDLLLSIGLFALICAVVWTALLPGWLWDRVGWRDDDARRDPPRRRGPIELALASLVLITLHWNLRTIDERGRVVPRVSALERDVIEALRLHQRWSMFAPAPGKNDGWWRAPGRLVGGGEVDLTTGTAPAWTPVDRADGHRPALHPVDARLELDRTKPRDVAGLYPNHRHRKFMNNLRRSRQLALRPRLAAYLCRRWNATHAGDERLRELRLVYMLERTPAPGHSTPPIQPVKVWHHVCADDPPASRSAGL
ncbi:MAG: HTTM domain-containing protein [Myxococcales bacterium]|nr:HTTM domain-containing protein [Myxococcales bacterium]MCB9755128.1 HTTM domain-containing protein [Myxococcales bacterium]